MITEVHHQELFDEQEVLSEHSENLRFEFYIRVSMDSAR